MYFAGTKGHTGYCACTFCHQVGVRIERLGFRPYAAFEATIARARTDFELRNQIDMDHQVSRSPFLDCKMILNMVLQFPIDVMHSLDLGVMLKLLELLIRLKKLNVESADKLLEEMKSLMPSDFSRRPRSLNMLSDFKANELRQIAVYLGLVIVKEFCSDQPKIQNFLQFFVAYRLVLGENGMVNQENRRLSFVLFSNFVRTFKEQYGEANLSFNVHSCLHVPECVDVHGPADQFSAYMFENFYQMLRKWIRKPSHYFEQIHSRWSETGGAALKKMDQNREFEFCKISDNKKDSCIMTHGGNIYQITKKLFNIHGPIYRGKEFLTKENYFDFPVPSSQLGIFLVSGQSEERTIQPADIHKKMVKIPIMNHTKFVVIPILHYFFENQENLPETL